MAVNVITGHKGPIARATLCLCLALGCPNAWAKGAEASRKAAHHPGHLATPDKTTVPTAAAAPGADLSTPRPGPIMPAPPPAAPEAQQPPSAPPSADGSKIRVAGDGEDDERPIAWTAGDGRMHHRPQMLTTDLGIWPDSFTVGLLWASPVLPRGFIRHVNDSFDLEFGFLIGAMRSDWYWADGTTSWQLLPAFGGRWNFFLTRNWSTFVTLKLAARIGLSGPSPGWFDVLAGLGANYRIKERVHLRLELNYPQGAVVGLSFPIGAL